MDNAVEDVIERLVNSNPDSFSRAFKMARRYAVGETLQEIGEDYGITRERVRQIINNETPWTTTLIGGCRRRKLESQASADREAVETWSRQNNGAPLAQAVDALGLKEETIRKYLGRRRARHERVERKSPARRTDESLLADLKRFHAETGETSAAAYRQWSKMAGVPGPQTVGIRFGSWNTAATRAGIKDARPIKRERRHSDADLWAAVLDGIRAGQFTAREFEDWLASVPGTPSFALIRQRLELNWIGLRDEAIHIVNGCSERDPSWIDAVSSPRSWPEFLEEENPLDHMLAARWALGKNITMSRYTEWAQAKKRPGAITLLRRSGKRWGELVEAVGGVTVQKQLRIPDDELLAWLRAFLEAEPQGSYPRYEQWREIYGAPGASTIATRFGGWDRARDAALAPKFEG